MRLAMRMVVWDDRDPEVLNARDSKRLQADWSKIRDTMWVKVPLIPYPEIVDRSNWRRYVVKWFIGWVQNLDNPGHKRKQLFLWGPPNSGKTYFVRHVLFGKMLNSNDSRQCSND